MSAREDIGGDGKPRYSVVCFTDLLLHWSLFLPARVLLVICDLYVG